MKKHIAEELLRDAKFLRMRIAQELQGSGLDGHTSFNLVQGVNAINATVEHLEEIYHERNRVVEAR